MSGSALGSVVSRCGVLSERPAMFGLFLLGAAVEWRLALDYQLYSFAFNPPAGATFGPGSARDQLYGAQIAIAFVL